MDKFFNQVREELTAQFGQDVCFERDMSFAIPEFTIIVNNKGKQYSAKIIGCPPISRGSVVSRHLIASFQDAFNGKAKEGFECEEIL